MGGGIEIRAAGTGDASGLADAWIEFGRYYADLDVGQFRVPDTDGLAAWFESSLSEDRGDDSLWLVAVRNERVIGFVRAQIWRPAGDAARHLMRDMSEPVLKVDSLMVLEAERRGGVGTTLMSAAERWGIERGATRALVISYANSPSSVPFYEDRMRYERKTIGFWKLL